MNPGTAFIIVGLLVGIIIQIVPAPIPPSPIQAIMICFLCGLIAAALEWKEENRRLSRKVKKND